MASDQSWTAILGATLAQGAVAVWAGVDGDALAPAAALAGRREYRLYFRGHSSVGFHY